MVNLIQNLTSVVAAAAPIKILDFTQSLAVDNTGQCGNMVAINMFENIAGLVNQEWTLSSPSPGLFTIQGVSCGTSVTWAGADSIGPIRFQGVTTNSASTVFRIVPAIDGQLGGPFNLIENSSGLVLRAWPLSTFSPSSPITFEHIAAGDDAQNFWIVNGAYLE